MSVVRRSCPQLLDPTLRTIQHPVDQKGISVGRDLGRDPSGEPHQSGSQSLAEVEDLLQARKRYLYLLPDSRAPRAGLAAHQEDAVFLDQLLLQPSASVGQIPKQLASHPIAQLRLDEQFLGQGDLRDVGGGELVGERNPIGGAHKVQLHPVDAESAPSDPSGAIEARGLSNLPRMQNRKQSRVDDQGLRVANELGKDKAPQWLQEMAQLPDPAVQGRRPKPYDPRKQVREEPLCVAQEGAFALHASKLLQEGEGNDLRVGELLERLVMPRFRVEDTVGVVYEAEQNDNRFLHLFQESRV